MLTKWTTRTFTPVTKPTRQLEVMILFFKTNAFKDPKDWFLTVMLTFYVQEHEGKREENVQPTV